MLKTSLILLALSLASLCHALEINTASEAQLDSIRGIGPATSRRILAERDRGDFKDWNDLMARVKGIRQTTATRYAEQGLTVNGQRFDNIQPHEAAPAPR